MNTNFEYYGFFINEETKNFLLGLIEEYYNPKFNKVLDSASSTIYCDHCTLLHCTQNWAFDLIPTLESLIDKTISIKVDAIGVSNKALAFKLEDIPDICANEIPHITIATYNNGKQKDSNNIDEWYDINSVIIDGKVKKILKRDSL